MNTVYGYWISPKNEIYEVESYSHEEMAYNILAEKFHMTTEELYNRLHDYNTPYRLINVYIIMFRLGYVRVVEENGTDKVNVEYRHDAKLSKLQKEFVKDANRVDKVGHVSRMRIN